MVTLLIIICILIFIVSAVKAVKGNRKGARKPPSIHLTESQNSYKSYRRKQDIRNLRFDQHEKKQSRIWSVLFIADSIYRCQAKHPTKQDWQYLDQAIAAVKEYKPQYYDIKVAIRFCQIEYAKGNCNRELNKQDLFTLRNIRQLIDADQLPVNRPKNI